ncbi:MAG: glycosyltransferase [Verrucomicrobia bacterium]|nr:glycosyltransferase [Verrucomicrobiota bacterium]
MVDVTIVVPILNEKDNIRPLYHSLKKALDQAGFRWEIVFVDDNSQDGTLQEMRGLISEIKDHSVKLIQRIHRFGLSSACVEGIMASHAPFIVVMDVDGQHDETQIPIMYHTIQKKNLDAIVGSRYCDTGSLGELDPHRAFISKTATYLARKIGKVTLTDPMSGFFMIRRSTLESLIARLYSKGFKILLDILLASPSPLKYEEIAYTMRARKFGESKLNSRVILDYLMLLAYHRTHRWIPLDFVLYLFVGCTGAIFHLCVLRIFLQYGSSFIRAQFAATLIAILCNFYLNNKITFFYFRLKGLRVWSGLGTFILVCSIGLAVNLACADYIYKTTSVWWISGGFGFLISGIWNYLCSKTIVWRAKT